MSKTNAIKMLNNWILAGRSEGSRPGTSDLAVIVKELEEDEVTNANIAVLDVSSAVFNLAKRIDDLEAWRNSIRHGQLTEISDYADGRTRLTIEI